MNDGYILIHRKIIDWQWYKDENTMRLFIDLLLDTNYEDSKKGFLVIKRGQCLTSLKRMQERTGLTTKQIRTSLDKLEKSQEIGKQTTNRYSIITIKNYDDYQKMDKQKANKGQTKGNIKRIPIKKNKNNKEIKEKYIKRKYGSFENVELTDEEYQKLKDRFSDYEEKIENLSSYIASKGAKYKSHYATILNWSRKDNKELPQWFNENYKKDMQNLDELEKVLEDFK